MRRIIIALALVVAGVLGTASIVSAGSNGQGPTIQAPPNPVTSGQSVTIIGVGWFCGGAVLVARSRSLRSS